MVKQIDQIQILIRADSAKVYSCVSGHSARRRIIHYHDNAISPPQHPGHIFAFLRFPAGDFILMSIRSTHVFVCTARRSNRRSEVR